MSFWGSQQTPHCTVLLRDTREWTAQTMSRQRVCECTHRGHPVLFCKKQTRQAELSPSQYEECRLSIPHLKCLGPELVRILGFFRFGNICIPNNKLKKHQRALPLSVISALKKVQTAVHVDFRMGMLSLCGVRRSLSPVLPRRPLSACAALIPCGGWLPTSLRFSVRTDLAA